MPLKVEDLKTFEAYKKAIRQDVTKIVDGGKTKFWVYKDIELPLEKTPAKKQKIAAFLAFVDNAGIRANASLKGRQAICLGTCSLEQGKVAFESLKGKVPYRPLRVCVPQFLGKPLYIPPNADPEADGDDDIASGPDEAQAKPVANQPPVEGTPTAQPDAAAVAAHWSALVKRIQAEGEAHPDKRAGLARAGAGIPDMIKAGKLDLATQSMDRVRELLAATSDSNGAADSTALKAAWDKLIPRIKEANNAGLTHAAAEAGPKLGWLVKSGKLAEARLLIVQLTEQLDHLKPEAAKPAIADITAAWEKLVPEMEKQSRVHPELKDAAMRTRGQLEELIKAGKFEAARHAVEELAKMLSHTLSQTKAEAGQAKQKAVDDPVKDAKKVEFDRKRQQMEKDIQRALREWPEGAREIRAAVALAADQAKGGDYASGLKVLAGLDSLLREAETGEEETAAPGLDEYRQTLRAFAKVRVRADQQIDALATAIAEKDPGDSDVIEALTEELEDSVGDIQGLIDAATVAAEDERAPASAALKTRIQNALKLLGSNVLLQHVQKNPYGVTIDIRATMLGALKDILESMPVEV